jgi:hypothetical protein
MSVKVEIELQELENLRREVRILEDENEKLKRKVEDLNEDVLVRKAVDLSWRLFTSYQNSVFEKLGFDQENIITIETTSDLKKELGQSWWASERLNFNLGAIVTNEYRKAFLKIGVTPKEKESTQESKLSL